MLRGPEIAAGGAITQLPVSGAFLGSAFAVPAGEGRDTAAEFGADLRGATAGYSTFGIALAGRCGARAPTAALWRRYRGTL